MIGVRACSSRPRSGPGGAYSFSSAAFSLCPRITGLADAVFRRVFSGGLPCAPGRCGRTGSGAARWLALRLDPGRRLSTAQRRLDRPWLWKVLGSVGRIWQRSASSRESVLPRLLEFGEDFINPEAAAGIRNRFLEYPNANLRENCWKTALRVARKGTFDVYIGSDLFPLCEKHTRITCLLRVINGSVRRAKGRLGMYHVQKTRNPGTCS